VDPVSHLAFGRIAIAFDQDRRLGSSAIAACLAGSVAPDIDACFMPRGWDIYLLHHQGGTHSLIGSIASAALAAGVVKATSRRARLASLLLAAWVGAAGHVALDFLSGADIRLWWPVGARAAVPLFAMADPWLGGILLLGVLCVFARPYRARQAAKIFLTVLVMFAATKAAMYSRAGQLIDRNNRAPLSRHADVEWGSLTRWDMYDAYPDAVDAGRVDVMTGAVIPLMHMPRNLEHPLVKQSWQFETVRNFAERHDITFAVIIAGAPAPQVLWSDLRYCRTGTAGFAPWSPTAPGGGLQVSCGLWFGGEFDPVTGVPQTALVYVGRIVQRRPARPRDTVH
jgi:membrane-bound metal-dependent hydrolase YbcI (DUF457 family)